jgi:1-acyl-sn-glycerol-3-phosphate acyltransferase
MTRPTREQLALLRPTERISFAIADFVNEHLQGPQERWNAAFMGALIWSAGGRRLNVYGLDRYASRGKKARLLLMANHRSFFDFYVITAILFWKTTLPRRILFPVRANFFYDHPAGPLLNAAMSGMAMFPPIVRDRQRASFNRYSLQRCLEELERPGTVMGIHPEGTRNKGDDPYDFLPAQPGAGKIALETTAPIVPIFIHGLSNNLPTEWRRNWLRPKLENPIDVVFGDEIDVSDLRAKGSRPATQKKAADRCLNAIRALAESHRAIHQNSASNSVDTSPMDSRSSRRREP